jgi:hypothetical protein
MRAIVLCLVAGFALHLRGFGIISSKRLALGRSIQNRYFEDQFIAAVLGEPVEGMLDPDPIHKNAMK